MKYSPSPSPRVDDMSSNSLSTPANGRMDISLVLNSSDEKKQQATYLPPMRTELPTAPTPTQRNDSVGCLFDCFVPFRTRQTQPSHPEMQQHDGSRQPSGPFTQLPSVNYAGYSMSPAPSMSRSSSLTQSVQLPSIRSLGWEHMPARYRPASSMTLNTKKPDRRSSKPRARRVGSPPAQQTPTPPHSPPNWLPGMARRHSHTGGVDSAPVAAPAHPERSSCNTPYNQAQVDWIRYAKFDLNIPYDSMGLLYQEIWPGEFKTGHCFSARLYRNNVIPRLDAHGNAMRDAEGRVVLDSAKMRAQNTPEGKEKGVPCSLIEKYPWRAVEYPWVREDLKHVARAIMAGIDPTDPNGKKANWRRVLYDIETWEFRKFVPVRT